MYQKRILPPTNPSPWDNTSKIPSTKPLSIGTTRSQQNNSTILAGNEFIGKSKWGRRKLWSFSCEFWFGHGLIYQEMGILRRSAFDPACLRRICLGRQGCEKRIRSGSILSEKTDMAAQRAGLRAAFKSPAREGRDTRRLQRVGSSYRRRRRMRERVCSL